jgi:hypothetical protein
MVLSNYERIFHTVLLQIKLLILYWLYFIFVLTVATHGYEPSIARKAKPYITEEGDNPLPHLWCSARPFCRVGLGLPVTAADGRRKKKAHKSALAPMTN